MIIIKATELYDGISNTKQKDKYITIIDDKISKVSDTGLPHSFKGYVTPAFIDPHSHIGMERNGEPEAIAEVNDTSNHVLPTHNPLNSIYFDDKSFNEAVDFGVLYSCVIPGSGNIIGGKAIIIKNFAKNRKTAMFKDYGYKMALGYNPMSTDSWSGDRPDTRMGVYSKLEAVFNEILNKKQKLELELQKEFDNLDTEKLTPKELKNKKKILTLKHSLEYTAEENELLELLSGNKTIKVHVHKIDDIYYLLDLVDKYKLNITIDHLCDVDDIDVFNDIKKRNINIVYGPIGGIALKVELKNYSYKNIKLLIDSGAFFGLMSDHPIIHTMDLRFVLSYFIQYGLTDVDAIKLLTYNNAKILGIDDQLGTIEPGKLASMIVWNRDPLRLGSYPIAVIAEGKIIRDFTKED